MGYTGHREDVGSGLVYAKARYYNADTKVFLSSDPYSWDSFTNQNYLLNPAVHNTYGYANNSPMKYVDPDGRLAQQISDRLNLGSLYSEQTQRDLQYLYDDNRLARTAMDNPDVAGGVVGVGAGAAAYGAGFVATKISTSIAYGVGTRVTANLTRLSALPVANSVADKMSKLVTRTGNTATTILDNASKSTNVLVDYANKGNVNIYTQQSVDKLTRVTTNPSITKVISVGTAEVSQINNAVNSGRMASMGIINTFNKVISVINNLLR